MGCSDDGSCGAEGGPVSGEASSYVPVLGLEEVAVGENTNLAVNLEAVREKGVGQETPIPAVELPESAFPFFPFAMSSSEEVRAFYWPPGALLTSHHSPSTAS